MDIYIITGYMVVMFFTFSIMYWRMDEPFVPAWMAVFWPMFLGLSLLCLPFLGLIKLIDKIKE